MSGLWKLALIPALIVTAQFAVAQQAATPQAMLSGAVALLGAANIQGFAFSGTAEWIAGATDQTGTFTANCNVSGSSQLALQLSNGSVTETRQVVNGLPSGSWTDATGQQHSISFHNLLTPGTWFCPVLSLAQISAANNLNIQFTGQETKGGSNVDHFIATAPIPDKSTAAALMTHLSQVDIYLDPQTFRPLFLDFTAHPDKDSGVDMAIEVQFSNYTQVNGVWIPFRIQRFVNSTLALDLQIQSATHTP
jgi:hypothetical protein